MARRWSDHDKNFGPFTYARNSKTYNPLAIILRSGDDDEFPGCNLRVSGFGHTFIVSLPAIIKPWREKVIAHWDQDTIQRLGRDWYWHTDEREYGFSYTDDMGGVGGGGFLQVFLGRQSHDSSTEQIWSWFIPWNNWRHVRHSLYDLKGNHFATEAKRTSHLGTNEGRDQYEEWRFIENECPSRTFCFADFDGEFLQAKTRIEERQWEMGTGWFKWLAFFKPPIIHRSLDIEFSGETGKRKGSWKGGTIGHSIEMRSGELHPSAFKRYCDEHQMVYKGEGIWLPKERKNDDHPSQTEGRDAANV